MKRLFLALTILLSLCGVSQAQVNNQLTGSGAPTGSCTSSQTYLDTTNHIGYHCNNETWALDATNFVPSVIVCAPQSSTTDTLTAAATSPTETFFATKCQIPANTITTGTVIRGLIGVDWTATATVPNFTFQVKLCTVSGCGSGTVVALYTSAVNAPAAGTFSSIMPFMIQGTVAPGASVAVAQSIGVGVGTNAPLGRNSRVTNVTGVPTNAILFLQFSITFSTNAATNSMTMTQLVFN